MGSPSSNCTRAACLTFIPSSLATEDFPTVERCIATARSSSIEPFRSFHMSLTPEQQQSIISQESAWIDADRFAPLDLSAFPSLQPPPPETSRDDGRFARDWRDTALSASSAELRKFVADPDAETL